MTPDDNVLHKNASNEEGVTMTEIGIVAVVVLLVLQSVIITIFILRVRTTLIIT